MPARIAALSVHCLRLQCGPIFFAASYTRMRNPKPETRNPKPETLNPNPETLNPKP